MSHVGLFDPLTIRSVTLPNRIVMSPMTRRHSPAGVPTAAVADYYERRSRGGTGLIVTEGVAIDHPSAVDASDVPRMHGCEALEGWRRIVDRVHRANSKIIPQLWHVGPLWGAMAGVDRRVKAMRPSGIWGKPGVTIYPQSYIDASLAHTEAMTESDISDVIAAYAAAARNAIEIGFDGIAIHGGHGYLLDAFLWKETNHREDDWGGDLRRRTRFPEEVVRAIRAAIGPDYPIFFRFSQHKQQDFKASIADSPQELGVVLSALRDAGVDVFDASIRRFYTPVFSGSELSLAGWAKKLTGAVTMAVGSAGMSAGLNGESTLLGADESIDDVLDRLHGHEFDLVAFGRLHLADPALAQRLRRGTPMPVFDKKTHENTLY